jgi:hypothetical protein
MKDKLVTCKNPFKTEAKGFDSYTYQRCGSCPFLHTYLADHWLRDVVRCDSPIPIVFGQTVKLTAPELVTEDDNKEQ